MPPRPSVVTLFTETFAEGKPTAMPGSLSPDLMAIPSSPRQTLYHQIYA